MTEGIIIAIIANGLTLIGVIISVFGSNKKTSKKIETTNQKTIESVIKENEKVINEFKLEVTKNQAVTDTKIEELKREVREHNNFAKRMPVVENQIENLNEKVNHFHKI